MRPLLDALAQSRRPGLAPQLALGAAGVAVIAAVLSVRGDSLDPCAHAETELAAVWNPERSERIAARLAATPKPYAESVARRVVTAANAFAAAWIEQRRDACRATRVREVASEALMNRRGRCLDPARQRFEDVLDVLETADASTIALAGELVVDRREVVRCSDTSALLAEVEPPTDGAARQAVSEVERQLSRASAELALGRHDDALRLLQAAAGEADSLDDPPARVELDRLLARALEGAGDAAAAQTAARRAFATALASKSPELVQQTSLALAELLLRTGGDPTEAQLHADLGLALAKRTTAYPSGLVDAQRVQGATQLARGAAAPAAAAFAEALRLAIEQGADPAAIARARVDHARALADLNRTSEALAEYSTAIDEWTGLYGAEHPLTIAAEAQRSALQRRD
jgi:tetratricopeptide (TPR) repeat protein